MFRRVVKEDRELFLNLSEEFYNSEAVLHSISPKIIESTFEEIVNSDRYLEAFIFSYDGEDCGYGLLAKTFSPEAGGICIWIEEIYIREAMRDKGLGSKFLNFVEDNYDFTRLRLEIEESNEKAQSLYERYGYKVLGYRQMHKDIEF